MRVDIDLSNADLSKLGVPTKDDWKKIAITEAKHIRTRTETKGQDINDTRFKPYSSAYKNWLSENVPKKDPAFPNQSLSGKMLGALGSGVSAGKNYGKISLSGTEGLKAFENEKRGRKFMGVSSSRADKISENLASLLIKRAK